MSISTEEKGRYLRETAIVLAREGFQTGKTDTGKLRVLLDGSPLCEVTENGGITYRNEDINEPERVAAKDMVYETVRNTAEYMHYFMENYTGAKQDFAIRSGLIQKEQLFTPEQMIEIYRCCADSVNGDFFELTGEQEKIIRSVQQQIEECVPDLDERIRQQEEALEQVAQEQTM